MKENEVPENSHKKLRILYFRDTDTLEVDNGESGDYGFAIAEHLTANSVEADQVVGFTLEHAAELLLPYLKKGDPRGQNQQWSLGNSPKIVTKPGFPSDSRKKLEKPASKKRLIVTYCKEIDVLDLKNGEPVKDGEDVSAGLVVFYNEADELVRFTLEDAAKLLLPCLQEIIP